MDSDVTGAFGSNTTNSFSLQSCTENCHVDGGYTLTSGMISNVDEMAIATVDEGDLELAGDRVTNFNALNWASKSEAAQLSHFVIERRLKGEAFKVIGQKLASEDSDDYTFEDHDVSETIAYEYRVTAVNIEDQEVVSETIGVDAIDVHISLSAYPNPVSDNLSIQLETATAVEQLSMRIYDGLGGLVSDNVVLDYDLARGTHSYSIDVSDLSAGVHYLNADMDGITVVKKIIVVDR